MKLALNAQPGQASNPKQDLKAAVLKGESVEHQPRESSVGKRHLQSDSAVPPTLFWSWRFSKFVSIIKALKRPAAKKPT